MSDPVGRKLGAYALVEEIGRGGMAVVYRAYHPPTARYVAVKVLPETLAHDASFLAALSARHGWSPVCSTP